MTSTYINRKTNEYSDPKGNGEHVITETGRVHTFSNLFEVHEVLQKDSLWKILFA